MKRTYVRVDLTLVGRWRVGTWQGGSGRGTHSTLRDPFDVSLPAIPSSGLAGSLRDHVRAVDGQDAAERLFGPHLDETGSSGRATVSPWWFMGTRLHGPGGSIDTRTQTAINRRRQAAENHSVHRAEEVVPAETTVDDGRHLSLYLSHDGEGGQSLIGYLGTWSPTIGGGRSRGLGQARVASFTHRTFDLANVEDLVTLAATPGVGADRIDRLLTNATSVDVDPKESVPFLRAEFLLSDGIGLNQDDAEHDGPWWYHGSQWKGVLRSRVEYIGRSRGHVACQSAASDSGRGTWSGCGACDVCKAFGSWKAAAAWEFETSAIDRGTKVTRTRVAIDPYTGGVSGNERGGATYKDGSLQGAPTVHLSIHQRVPVTSSWVEQALLHAIRDLADGLVAIGPRGGTGLGTLTIQSLELADPFGGLGATQWVRTEAQPFVLSIAPVLQRTAEVEE